MTSKPKHPPVAPRELCPDILALAITRKITPKRLSTQLQELIAPLFPMTYTKAAVKTVSNAIKAGASDIDALKEISFSFPYNREMIKLLAQQPVLDGEDAKVAGCLAMFSYLAWMMAGEAVLQDNQTLTLLVVISGWCKAAASEKIKRVAFECFRQMFLLNLKFVYKDGSFTPYLETLEDMLMNVSSPYAVNYFDIVPKLVAIYLDTTEHASTLDGKKLLEVLTHVITRLKKGFPQEVVESILPMTCSAFNDLHAEVMMFAVSLADVYGVDIIRPYLAMVPLAVFRMIESGEPKNPLAVPSAESFVTLEKKPDAKLATTIVGYATLDPDFEVKRTLLFPMRLPLEQMIREDLLAKTVPMLKVFSANADLLRILVGICSAYFQNELSKKEYVFDTFAVFLYILRIARKKSRFPAPTNIVLHNQLFDPAVTLFTQPSHWQLVSTLRSYALELIVGSGAKFMVTAIHKYVSTPYLFAELIYRVLPKTNDFKVNIPEIPSMSQLIFYPMGYYQSFCDVDKESKDLITVARISLFVFLETLLKRDDNFVQFMEDNSFVEPYLSLVYEPVVRPLVLTSLVRYLKIGNCNSSMGGGQAILKLMADLAKKFDQAGYVALAKEIIVILNEELESQTDLRLVFEPLIPIINRNLFQIQKSQDAFDFMTAYMSFLVYTATYHKANMDTISAITNIAQRLWGDDPPESFYFEIVRWAAGSHSANPATPFALCQPRPLSILFNVFHNSHLLDEIFQFVQSLCDYSETNCKLIHDNEIDTALLGIVEKCRTFECVDLEMIEKAFQLFVFISSSTSSVSSVQQFVSLLCPIEGKSLPTFHMSTLSTLYQLLQNENQTITIPFDEQVIFRIRGLTSVHIVSGFTVFFSLVKAKTKAEKYIIPLEVMDAGKHRVSILITMSSLVVEVAEPMAEPKFFEQKLDLDCDEWSLISCSFQPTVTYTEDGKHIWNFSVTTNKEICEPIPIYISDFVQGRVTSKIGGCALRNGKPEIPSGFNVVAMFPLLLPQEVHSLCQGGEISENIVKKATFWFDPLVTRDSISLRNILAGSQISCIGELESCASMSFANTLVELCGVDMLLPLFAQWRLPLLNGETPENLRDLTLDIFNAAILISAKGQEQFCNKDGFIILAYLLQQNNDEEFTLDLYMRFVWIFNRLASDDLRKQLFRSILTNDIILKRCTRQVRLDVYRHWKAELFPANIDVASRARSFNWILNTIITLFLDYADEEFASPDISEMMTLMTDIALLIALKRMRDIDGYGLIATIVSASNEKMILYLLNLFRRVAIRKDSPFKKLNRARDHLICLMALLRHPSESVNIAALEVLVDTAKIGLFKDKTVSDIVVLILHHLNGDFVTVSRFGMLMDLVIKGDQHLFLVAAWVAMNLGGEFINKLYSVLLPGSQFATFPFWTVWSLVSLSHVGRETQKMILEFLVKCSVQPVTDAKYDALVGGIEIMSRATGINAGEMQRCALWEYTKSLFPGEPTKEDIIAYFRQLRFLLFYQNDPQCDETLEALYHNSPFCDHTIKPTRRKQKRRRRTSRRSISTLFMDGPPSEPSESVLEVMKPLSTSTTPHRRTSRRIGARRSSIFNVADMAAIRQEISEASTPLAETPTAMMSCDIDTTVLELSEGDIVYHLGIRRDEEGTWRDLDFAKTGLKIFVKYPYDEIAPTALAIAGLMLHYDPEVAESVAALFRGKENPDLMGPICYYDYHAVETGHPIICPVVTQDDRICNHFKFVQKFTKRDDNLLCSAAHSFLVHFRKYQQATMKFIAYLNRINTRKIQSDATNLQAEYEEEIGRFYTDSSRKWSHFLHCVTIDRAPWRNSLPSSSIREQHFKRDFTMCANLTCPKVKQNMRFDNHMLASQIRDTGLTLEDPKTRDSQVNETTEKLKNLYMNHGTNSLFELAEEAPLEKMEEAKSPVSGIADCIVELDCEIIKQGTVTEATFALMRDTLVLSKSEKKVTVIKLSNIASVFLRTRFHHQSAIEIFMNDGRSLFINFPSVVASSVLKSFKSVRTETLSFTIQSLPFKPAFEAGKWTEKWKTREISNFQYLMRLNFDSGRSFNDLSQYPVFPWILKDYVSKELDLTNPDVFRDLSKPIGAVNQQRLAEIMDKVNQLKESDMYPYMYSSGFSCPLSVCLFMIRLEPFTSLHIEIQGGKFDHAARLFMSIKEAFRLVTTTHNDYRELIPEFFFMPEFLVNRDRFDLGSFENRKVDDVELPAWASSPIEFIYLHRKALESDHVSQHLNSWIDLMWGEKQSGEKAEAAYNVYMRELYSDIWSYVDMRDACARAQTEALLSDIGQIPPPLFDKPHPIRNPRPTVTLHPSMKTEPLTKAPISAAHINIVSKQEAKIYFFTEDKGICDSSKYDIEIIMNGLEAVPTATKRGPVVKGASMEKSASMSSQESSMVHDSSFGNMKRGSFREGSQAPLVSGVEVTPSFSGDGFDIVHPDYPNMLNTIKKRESVIKITHNSDIIMTVSSGEWTLISDRDSSFSLYKANTLKFTIPLFTSYVQTAYFNPNFNTAVCGTRDSSLIFCSLTTGYVTRTFKLPHAPEMILCTSSWGFVCVYSRCFSEGRSRFFISLYSVNGDFIRMQELEHAIVAWNSFSSPDGFDYIIMATEDMNLYIFEAFYLNPGASLTTTRSLAAAVNYSTDQHVAVVVTLDGNVLFVPASFD